MKAIRTDKYQLYEMKTLGYILTCAAVLFSTLSCDNGDIRSGSDAVIGFEKPQYTVQENVVYGNMKGYVRIPVKVDGSNKKYPITFDVRATALEGIDDFSNTVKFTQLENLAVKDSSLTAYVEFKIEDNDEVNSKLRRFALNIVNSDGASLGQTATVITIEDDEFFADPAVAYSKLQGEWTFSANGVLPNEEDGSIDSYAFDVNISGGFTPEEIEENKGKKLVCWGFASLKELFPESETKRQPVWYIEMGNENNLRIILGSVMTTDINFKFDWDKPYNNCLSIASSFDPDLQQFILEGYINATWNKDYDTITFDDSAMFGAAIAADNTLTGFIVDNMYTNIIMTKKN